MVKLSCKCVKCKNKQCSLCIEKENNPFAFTSSINFELSNYCNISHLHRRCPVSLEKEPILLSSKIIYSVLDELNKARFIGTIAYHNYNEPLIDPRLFKFIEYSKTCCAESRIFLRTNGAVLSQQLADELVGVGVSEIYISIYSNSEYDRLSKIKVPIKYSLVKMDLDDRLHDYEKEIISCKNSCGAPLDHLVITRDGRVSLCCHDWKRQYCFGDLRANSLGKILREKDILDCFKGLKNGNRYLDFCRRCRY